MKTIKHIVHCECMGEGVISILPADGVIYETVAIVLYLQSPEKCFTFEMSVISTENHVCWILLCWHLVTTLAIHLDGI